MNALTIVEKISTDLLVKGKIELATQGPLLQELRNASLDESAARLLEKLSEVCITDAKGQSIPGTYAAALAAIEELTTHLAKISSSSENSDCQVLKYDTSHDREILDTFFCEVASHLQSIEQHLLSLEKQPTDKDALNAVFGAMHSLKGVMGFLNVAPARELAHEAETLLQRARERETGIHTDECDAVLCVVDSLREIQSSIAEHTQHRDRPFPRVPLSCGKALEQLKGTVPSALKQASTKPGSGSQNASVATRILEPGVVHPATEQRSGMRAMEQSGLVRVKVEKLDCLIDAIGEMVITLTQVQEEGSHTAHSPRMTRKLSHLSKIVRDLQDTALSLRMFPLHETFARMSRLVRDLARKQGKDVAVSVIGEETELDKNIIEKLIDPLTHLVRNAVDHGVNRPEERIAAGKLPQAQITIRAGYQGSNVVVEISDDGKGLDLAHIEEKARSLKLLSPDEIPTDSMLREFIFVPGFSTAKQVTEVSGRGVGLDVVKRSVETLGGSVSVSSIAGVSTTFTLVLPLTLAIIDGLAVRMGADRYILPMNCVQELLQPKPSDYSTVHGNGELIAIRNEHLPLVRLSDFTGRRCENQEPWNAVVVVMKSHNERYGLLVDELIGQQQVVIKNLGECLNGVMGVAGGAILGDGRVALILDGTEVLAATRQSLAMV